MTRRIALPALAGASVLLAVTVMALGAPLWYPGDPLDMAGPPLVTPFTSWAFPLGTDPLGRDTAAGLAHGARASLTVGASAAALGVLIGTLVGVWGGYAGGWADAVLTRLTEVFQTIPTLLLAIVLIAILDPSTLTVAGAIGLASWPTIARLVRAQFRSLREADFVTAARSLGYSPMRIIAREILPNALAPVVVSASAIVASAILMESALSFLGLGDPNTMSWGGMIGNGRDLLRTAWQLTAIPGLTISIVVLSLNLIGDGINDWLNPRRGQA